MTVAALRAPLDIQALRAARAAAAIGHAIEHFETLGSTSDRARELAEAGAPEGVVVIAEKQTQGRGRLGRRWESPPNRNLYVSILLRPAIDAEEAPLLALVAGLATAEAVAEWAPQAQIKWPNDVLIDGRKTAGILTELYTEAEQLAVIAGIGVNLNLGLDELPPELRDKATSVYAATGRAVDRAVFAATLLSKLEERYRQFRTSGFAAMRQHWNARSCLNGHRVTISGAGVTQRGKVIGMGDDGTLQLLSEEGTEMRVVAGDVTVLDGYGSSVAKQE